MQSGILPWGHLPPRPGLSVSLDGFLAAASLLDHWLISSAVMGPLPVQTDLVLPFP